MTFSKLVRMVGNIVFFVNWFLDGVRSIKEVQKPSGLFFNFYCSIYNAANPIINAYKVNSRRPKYFNKDN